MCIVHVRESVSHIASMQGRAVCLYKRHTRLIFQVVLAHGVS